MTNSKNVFVIGTLKDMGTIQKVSKIFEQVGHEVRFVQRKSILLEVSIIEVFENIDWTDIVIVVPKKDKKLGTRTLYESSYAKHIGRDVYIFDREIGSLNSFGEDYHDNHIFLKKKFNLI